MIDIITLGSYFKSQDLSTKLSLHLVSRELEVVKSLSTEIVVSNKLMVAMA